MTELEMWVNSDSLSWQSVSFLMLKYFYQISLQKKTLCKLFSCFILNRVNIYRKYTVNNDRLLCTNPNVGLN